MKEFPMCPICGSGLHDIGYSCDFQRRELERLQREDADSNRPEAIIVWIVAVYFLAFVLLLIALVNMGGK